MAYCRFAWDGSDVYVYDGREGLVCCGCRLNDGYFVAQEPQEMISHLAEHRRAGHFVPEYAITRLWDEIPGATAPKQPEPRTLTIASLVSAKLRLEIEIDRLNALEAQGGEDIPDAT